VNIWFEGLTLPVSDLDTSIRFYESLGFVTEIRVERFGLLRFGSGTLGLLAAGPRVDRDTAAGGGTLRPFVQVEMGTDDLDALYADFITRGIPVHTAPRDRGFERQMQLRDPDGFTIEYAQGNRGHNNTGETTTPP
jgi:catechol 2,3-dioxygenase-like lactoylglutathione lyase family enzyme